MKLRDRLLLGTAPLIAALVMRLLHGTLRCETIGGENLTQLWVRKERVIISFWHDQLLLMVFAYPGKGAKLLISPSNDGELIARTMRFFSHDSVRGSSSRGGREAFKELMRLSQIDADIVLTPDGPRGPRHELKDGVLTLARLSGRPIVPMAFVCSRGYRFHSWDRFLLAYPFSRAVYSFGPPIYFEKKAGMEEFRERVKNAMRENSSRARQRLEAYGLSAV